jgi:hypothetical protein
MTTFPIEPSLRVSSAAFYTVTMREEGGLAWVAIVLAVGACSSSEEPSSGGKAGSNNTAGKAGADSAAGKGGADSAGGTGSNGGSPAKGGSPSKGGSSADVFGPSCPDGSVSEILSDRFPMPTAACAQFVEEVCPGKLDECAHQWCGDYFACACQCSEDDMSCYARCGFPGVCNTCIDRINDCGIGIDIQLDLHPGTPCYPPID